MIDGMIVREMNRRCNYDLNKMEEIYKIIKSDVRPRSNIKTIDKTEMVLAVDLNKINKISIKQLSIDFITRAELLIEDILANPPFEIVAVHDEFKAHPNNMDTVRYWYTILLAELADSHIIQNIIRQITGNNKLVLTRASETLGDKIRKSNYALG